MKKSTLPSGYNYCANQTEDGISYIMASLKPRPTSWPGALT